MRILYCDNGFTSKKVDYMYLDEYNSARQKSFQTSLISFEEIQRGNIDFAIKNVKPSEEKEIGIYRGWMFTPDQYKRFYNALLKRNIQLINNPTEYKFCHYLPENYEAIKNWTPKTTFRILNAKFKISDFQKEIEEFGNKPIVIKDYVKSQKHYWREACFIPNAADKEKVKSVVNRFIELQGSDLNEGLVFREYVELEELGTHFKSGMPLTKEFRVFVKNGKVMMIFKYWDEGNYQNIEPITEKFEAVFSKVKSNFFTMDIAKKKDGSWLIVELGDGQVAGLPDHADKDNFYDELKTHS